MLLQWLSAQLGVFTWKPLPHIHLESNFQKIWSHGCSFGCCKCSHFTFIGGQIFVHWQLDLQAVLSVVSIYNDSCDSLMSCKAFLDVWKWSKFFFFPLEIHLRDFCKALAKMKNDWKLYVGETYGMKGGVLYLMHIFFLWLFLCYYNVCLIFLSARDASSRF